MNYITNDIINWANRAAAAKKRKKNWFVDADEVVGEALLKVVKAMKSGSFVYESEKKLKYYIDFAITTAACTLMQKAAKDAHQSIDVEDSEGNTINEPIYVEQRAEIEDAREELEPYLEQLNEDREIALRLALDGLKPREMAEQGYFSSASRATKTKFLAIQDVKNMIICNS